jgi:hypothetical protein
MHRKRTQKHKWRITSQIVYKFGREERVQLAYEMILPTEKIKLKGEINVPSETGSNRLICQGIK